MQLKFIPTLLVIFFQLITINIPAQMASNSILSNEQIEKQIDANNNNPEKRWELINFYIKKSKTERNVSALFYAYRYASMASSYPENLKYADSALTTAKESQVKKILLDAYLNRGNINMSERIFHDQRPTDDPGN